MVLKCFLKKLALKHAFFNIKDIKDFGKYLGKYVFFIKNTKIK